MESFIHPLADVKTKRIGIGSKVWQYVVILSGAQIGSGCNICSHCFVENDVVIGDRVTIKNGVQLWDGLRIGDDVFIGPNVSFGNDRYPKSRLIPTQFLKTVIEDGSSIGSGATVLPGVIIGSNAMVGAGAVVTSSVPSNSIVVGNPARIVGYRDTNTIALQNQSSELKLKTAKIGCQIENLQVFRLPRIHDIRGSLSVGELSKFLPFAVQRYFLVFDVPSAETRGEHAHKACHQFLICAKGKFSIIADDGVSRREFDLEGPDLGLYLPPMIWGIQYKFSSDAVLLVLASHPYDPEDYIRDYEFFLELKRKL